MVPSVAGEWESMQFEDPPNTLTPLSPMFVSTILSFAGCGARTSYVVVGREESEEGNLGVETPLPPLP